MVNVVLNAGLSPQCSCVCIQGFDFVSVPRREPRRCCISKPLAYALPSTSDIWLWISSVFFPLRLSIPIRIGQSALFLFLTTALPLPFKIFITPALAFSGLSFSHWLL